MTQKPILLQSIVAILLLLCTLPLPTHAKSKFDYSTVYVPEEGGVSFERITSDDDCVNGLLISKSRKFFGSSRLDATTWWVNPQIAISKDGSKIAYLNWKNNTSNVMVKQASQGGSSTQRTFRTNVTDAFSITPYAGLDFRVNLLFNGSYDGESESLFDDPDMNRFQMGWHIGTRFEFNRISLGLSYGTDFIKLYNYSDDGEYDRWSTNNLALSVGYRF